MPVCASACPTVCSQIVGQLTLTLTPNRLSSQNHPIYCQIISILQTDNYNFIQKLEKMGFHMNLGESSDRFSTNFYKNFSNLLQ
jgi:hypothetical protein